MTDMGQLLCFYLFAMRTAETDGDSASWVIGKQIATLRLTKRNRVIVMRQKSSLLHFFQTTPPEEFMAKGANR